MTLTAPDLTLPADGEVAPGVFSVKCGIANCVLVGDPDSGDRGWTLVDAGLPGFAGKIHRAAEARFGKHARPAAVILTHGHFDHIGALKSLLRTWGAPTGGNPDLGPGSGGMDDHGGIPVYAHRLEFPYLTGRSSYPPADPSVGGGLLSRTSPLFPSGPFDFGPWLRELPREGPVPTLPGWRVIETPGHSPGHVSLFREEDGVLLAGDAFVTTKQESLFASVSGQPFAQGPPWYYTPDFERAHASVQRLRELLPSIALTGHGPALSGESLLSALSRIDRDWDDPTAGITPSHGRYRHDPAVTDETGIRSLPPAVSDVAQTALVISVSLATLAGIALLLRDRRSGGA